LSWTNSAPLFFLSVVIAGTDSSCFWQFGRALSSHDCPCQQQRGSSPGWRKTLAECSPQSHHFLICQPSIDLFGFQIQENGDISIQCINNCLVHPLHPFQCAMKCLVADNILTAGVDHVHFHLACLKNFGAPLPVKATTQTKHHDAPRATVRSEMRTQHKQPTHRRIGNGKHKCKRKRNQCNNDRQ